MFFLRRITGSPSFRFRRSACRGLPAPSSCSASILRFRADRTSDRAHPRGLLLRSNTTLPVEDDLLRVAEEEVPRSGVVVRRIVQLARGPVGATVLWLGRDMRAGRGEGGSGMRFDSADPAE